MAFNKVSCAAALLILLVQVCHSQIDVCGQPPLNNKIVGGQVASAGSWPWQVSLQTSRSHFCGGSLINSQWVLTAAHCFVNTGYPESSVTAVLGLQTLSGSNPNAQRLALNQIIVHPNYNSNTNDNDICLLQLASAVTFTNYIQPVCLAAPGSTFYNGTDSWVTGWGVTSDGSHTVSQTLMEVEIPVVGNRKCNCDYGVGSITSNMICAGLSAGGKDSCQGDSGGPMVSKQGGRWIQSGVVSNGRGCALPNFPGIYTRVSRYQSWINSQITSNKPGFITYTSTGTDGDLSVSCTGLPPSVFCGQAALNTRILGGNSSAGMWPWMVSLQRNGSHVCGGTLVAVDSVLSDASCISSSSKPSDWTAVLGLLSQYGSNPNQVSLTVTNIARSNLTGSNIAVLHLASQTTLSNYIQPICLGDGQTFAVGSTCWAAGWSSGTGGVQEFLQETQTSVVNCGNSSTSGSICTEAIALDSGDVGGPLMCKLGGYWFEAAVLTVTTNNSTNQTRAAVSVFTSLSAYGPFLRQTLGSFLTPPTSTGEGCAHSPSLLLHLALFIASLYLFQFMAFYKVICVAALLLYLVQECYSQLSVCGQPPLNNKIVGGQVASAGSWPWQVSLQISGGHFCGGSLINSQWVLTAAHCFESSASSVTAVLGLQTQSGSNPNAQSVALSQIIVHPNYNSATKDNDICLLQLASAVTFTSYIQPVCLAAPGSTFYNGTDSWVTGWGVTSSGSDTVSQTLMEVEIPVVGNRQCNCDYGVGSITSNMMCAGLSAGGKDSCQGDSGGPMVSKQGGRWIQSGVVSFGYGCGFPNFPGVYTRVSQYQSWINGLITSNQPGFITYTSTGTDGDLSVYCAGLTAPVFCGQAALNTRILGGNSSAGMWPWMVSLQRNGSHVCGGTLVAVDSVLSDASCITSSSKPTDWTAVLGRLSQYGSNPNQVSLNVTNITLSNLTGSNIAVLHLASQTTLSNYIQPICLGDGQTFAVGSTCWAAGWSSGRGGVQGILQETQTSVVNCGNSSTSGSICIGAITLDQGDAGGPLMCKLGSYWYQAAVLTVTTNNSTNQTRAAVSTFTTLTAYDAFLRQTLGSFLSPPSSSGGGNASASTSTGGGGLHLLLFIASLCLFQ
ncbi:transmembrane protease serine 9-like [Betta splendens]|uniref:Transmembrane protease serine 9-like n=1 Tax=Betta splendens TaxID=158456 RepID=A0A6P7NBL4_BETSP|nr:transmembrane protease serine 9-like [Betta splendens]